MKKQYIYPQNMKLKPKLWLWSVRDLIIIGISSIPAILAVAKLHFFIPAAMAAVYAFLSIRFDDRSVLDYIKRAVSFFVSSQQSFFWKEDKR